MFKNLQDKLYTIAGLDKEASDYLCSRIRVRDITSGQHIIQGGQTCDFIAFVEKGLLRSYLFSENEEVNSEFFFEDSFASAFTSFLTQRATTLYIQALEDCRLFFIQKKVWEELYRKDLRWYAVGKYIFEVEFIKKCVRESSFLEENARQRYLSLLDQYPGIEDRVPQFQIASYLGIRAETLSRIRSVKLN